MLANDVAVVDAYGREGYVQRFSHGDACGRHWLIGWDDGFREVMPESALVDIDRREWFQALEGVPADERCISAGYGRQCMMPAGHRTRRHRCGEISWADDRHYGEVRIRGQQS